MTRSPLFLCTVALTAFAMNALVASADFTFQTSPSSKQILSANSGLAVRWEIQPGNSPDSNSPAPNLLTVSLGYRDASGTPQILFPPLNGVDSNVPLQSKQFIWAKIDFNIFTANKEGLPALNANSQFFVVLADQVTGYRSNGQIFSILSSTAAPAPAPSATAPVSAPAASPTGKPKATTAPSSQPSGPSPPPFASAPSAASTGGASTSGSSAGGASGGNDNPAPDAVASSAAQPTAAAGSSTPPGQGSDAPKISIGFQSLWTINLAFAGAFACIIIF